MIIIYLRLLLIIAKLPSWHDRFDSCDADRCEVLSNEPGWLFNRKAKSAVNALYFVPQKMVEETDG